MDIAICIVNGICNGVAAIDSCEMGAVVYAVIVSMPLYGSGFVRHGRRFHWNQDDVHGGQRDH